MGEREVKVNDDVKVFGGPYAHRPGDIVVVNQHRDLLLAELPKIDVRSVTTSTVLDLSLIALVHPRSTAATLIGRVRREVPDAGKLEATQPLDQIMWALRKLIGARWAGWSPLMGKNRLVGSVHGVGEVNHGGAGDPAPIVPAYSRASRSAGSGRGVRVGVLDTGFSPQPWLAGGWAGRFSDQVDDTRELLYTDGHATFVAGLILEQAPAATVEVRRVLDSTDDPATNGSADSWSVGKAIVEFGNSGLDVLNLSFVCYTEDGQAPLVLSRAIDRLPPDLVVVAAAGNHGGVATTTTPDGSPVDKGQAVKPGWPAALDGVIAVGAVTEGGSLTSFCPDAPWIDVLARGDDLVSTYLAKARSKPGAEVVPFEGWARWEGTSFSAAMVSGAVAASTERGRTSARSAVDDILASLRRSPATTVGDTGAKILRLQNV